MESLNLNTLASSLPTAYQNAEKDLVNNFRAAALSITTLYRSSRQNSKRAYNAGYAAACQDLLTMIQQGVSLDPSGSLDAEGGGMTIGRVMDWTEARLEAIKSREEEEDEDEEREKEKERGRPPAGNPGPATKPDEKAYTTPETSSTVPPPKDRSVSLPTPNSPHSQPSAQFPCEPSSPSPPPATAVRPIQRPLAAKPRARDLTITHTTSAAPSPDYVIDNLSSNASYPEVPIPITVGTKRRHGLMMMLDASSPVVGSSSSSSSGGLSASGAHHSSGGFATRRRTRSSKSLALQQSQSQNIIQPAPEAMDVEEEGGRERKRIARR
ncbi:hypothetical protein L208DRAFT_1367702 [Tricholoma matsutake]|nr:hypothetical protein L208DRAFT_1447766 [Tricholoma matsutake 945]KAF8225943.1 hypothetical protein L208DRAFT_1367702 [Tricholoma matsutake 945]